MFRLKLIAKNRELVKNMYFARTFRNAPVFDKSSTFLNFFYLRRVLIYKGHSRTMVKPYRLFIGSKLGEFVLTRKFFYYPQRERKKKR